MLIGKITTSKLSYQTKRRVIVFIKIANPYTNAINKCYSTKIHRQENSQINESINTDENSISKHQPQMIQQTK